MRWKFIQPGGIIIHAHVITIRIKYWTLDATIFLVILSSPCNQFMIQFFGFFYTFSVPCYRWTSSTKDKYAYQMTEREEKMKSWQMRMFWGAASASSIQTNTTNWCYWYASRRLFYVCTLIVKGIVIFQNWK